VWLASHHMDGVVAEWYYALECEYGLVLWARFAEFVNLRFKLPLRSNPLGEFKELRRAGSVKGYQRQFLALLCCCDGLSAIHAMNLFTAGLSEPMTSDVEMQRPADLQAAMSLARAFERRANVAVQTPTPRYTPHSHSPASGGSITMTSTAAAPVVPSVVVSVTTSSQRLRRGCISVDCLLRRWRTKERKASVIFAWKSSRWNTSVHLKGFFSWNWKTTMIWSSSLMSSVSPCML
jgi:hypothetical protein